MILQISDKKEIYDFLRKDIFLFAYHIGDLDDFFFKDCTWYALEHDSKLIEVVLLYTGLSTPTLLAFGSHSNMGVLLREISDNLPDRFFCHHIEGFEEYLIPRYQRIPLGTHLKMKLQVPFDKPLKADVSNCVQLAEEDEQEVLNLYSKAYPESYFEPHMLSTGDYFGIKDESRRLSSIAGVHVLSREYRIAVIGNVATRPDARGKGLATKCVARLLLSLAEEVVNIGLNVRADNLPAIRLYRGLGFELHCEYEESYFKKA